MFSRVKQGLMCLFCKFDKKSELAVKEILSDSEFKIFNEMDEYDKEHSFRLYLEVLKQKSLKDDINFLKLALLHDCGKGRVTIFRRVKKVLIGDKKLEKHPEIAFEKLKDINYEVANLCKIHHSKNLDWKMKIFQNL